MTQEVDPPSDSEPGPEAEFGFGKLFVIVPDAVIVGDASTGRIVLWNPAAAAMFGYDQAEGQGLLIEDLVAPAMRSAHRRGMQRLAGHEPTPLLSSESTVELPACRKDGMELWVELRLAHISGRPHGPFALAIIRDITARREAEAAREAAIQELQRLQDMLEQQNVMLDEVSRTDLLTGLGNRRHVDEHLAKAVAASSRNERPVSVLLLDLDNFKSINTQFGHPVGDEALKEVAARLRPHVRAEDTLGRWGGEEFLVVLPGTSPEKAVAVAERFRQAIAAEPILAEGSQIRLSVSIGVAGSVAPTQEQLVVDADAALSTAKTAGKNRVVVRHGSPTAQ